MRRAPLAVCALGLLFVGCDAAPCGPGALCLAPPLRISTGFSPDALTIADIDGDGAADLAAASSEAGTIKLLWGADGGFGDGATSWSVGQGVTAIVAADLDGDGHLDLAAALPDDDAVVVVRGRGGRRFAAPRRHATGPTPRALIAADLDGAGPPELVTANLGDGSVRVLRDFVTSPAIVVGPGPRGLATGDLDGDGDLDLAVALADSDALQVLLGDGAGGLSPGPLHAVGAAPYSLVAADLDGDGRLDLASADRLDDRVSVVFGAGAEPAKGRAAWPVDPAPGSLVAVRRGQDLLPVLAVMSEGTSSVQLVDAVSGPAASGAPPAFARALATGDLEGDGGDELVYAAAGAGQVGVLRPTPGLRAVPLWTGPRALSGAAVDLAGDGEEALLLALRPGVAGLRRGAASETQELALPLAYPLLGARVGELTGDDRRDLVTWDGSTVIVLVAAPDDGFVAAAPLDGGTIVDVAIGDVEGDGRSEVLVLSRTKIGTDLRVLDVDATGGLTPRFDLSLAAFYQHMTPLAADGDADLDLVLTGSGAGVALLLLEGTSSVLSADLAQGLNHPYGPPTIVDLDGDGRLDLLVCDEDAAVYVNDMLGARVREAWPVEGCADLEIRDLDGDGRRDVLVFTGDFDTRPWRLLWTPWFARPEGWTRGGSQALVFDERTTQAVVVEEDAGLTLAVLGVDGSRAERLTLAPGLGDAGWSRLADRSSMRLGDLDGDGAADLLGFGAQVSVALGDGRGGFGAAQQRHVATMPGMSGTRVSDAVLADFDGDGDEEAVLAVAGLGVTLARLELDAAGGPSLAVITVLPRPDAELHAGDLDGDGVRDLLVTSREAVFRGWWLRGGPDGLVFAMPVGAPDGTDLEVDALADLDGDGRIDLVGGDPVAFARWQDGAIEAPRAWGGAAAQGGDSLVIHDLDNDRRPDLLAADAGPLLLIRGGGATPAAAPRQLLDYAAAVATADLDEDGRHELLVSGFDWLDGRALLYVGRAQGDLVFTLTGHDLGDSFADRIDVVDVDGDGHLDIAMIDGDGLTIARQTP